MHDSFFLRFGLGVQHMALRSMQKYVSDRKQHRHMRKRVCASSLARRCSRLLASGYYAEKSAVWKQQA